jgi:hypothetical protein
MKHIVLLGDSIFDNAAYVSGGPDVIRQLHSQLPEGWKATLKAIDGSVIDCVRKQLSELPLDVTHLVISVGGNDALNHASMLEEKAHSVADTLNRLADVAEIFQFHYQRR